MNQNQYDASIKRSLKMMLLVCVLCAVFCVGLFSATTYAWFTDSITAQNSSVTAADYGIISSLSKDGATVTPDTTNSNGVEEYSLTAGEYLITFTAYGSASTGFAFLTVATSNGSTTYYTNQIKPGEVVTVALTCSTDIKIKLDNQWGQHGRTENVISTSLSI